jgi:hypothetical protein
MEEPNRSKILKSYEILCGQWDETVARARENVAAGTDDADIIAFEGGALLAHEGQTIDNLAFTLAAVMLKQAKESPRVRGARKAAVPAKRPRKKPAEVLAAEAKIEHGPHPLEADDDVAAA